MNTTKKYSGIVIPAITPLTADHQLDEGAVEKIFDNFYKHKLAPFILGTTGESASLPMTLKKAYVAKAASLQQKDILLYAGISSNCLEESISLAKYSFDHGIAAVAATLPSYYEMTESQMEKYFVQLADALGGPMIIYNIPATTHMSIPLELIDKLSHHENIVGTKDSERSDKRLQRSIQLWAKRKDFSHFTGWAGRSAKALIEGSDGLIPSTGNLFPALYDDMLKAVRSKDHNSAMDLQRMSDDLGNLYQHGRTLGSSLGALKVLMEKERLCSEFVMPPLQCLSAEEKFKLINKYEDMLNGSLAK